MTTVNEKLREAAARIIDPNSWQLIDHWRALPNRPDLLLRVKGQAAPSLAKADAILALTPVEGVGESAALRSALSRHTEQMAFDGGEGRRAISHVPDNPYDPASMAAQHAAYDRGFAALGQKLCGDER